MAVDKVAATIAIAEVIKRQQGRFRNSCNHFLSVNPSPSSPSDGPFAFFLGGHDLEMVTIGDLLQEARVDCVYDKQLRWGAKASHYHKELLAAQQTGRQCVLVELDPDVEIPQAIWVDHHNERAGADKPTSLHQIFALLDLPNSRWDRWLELVAANDRGHIPAMLAAGATRQELRRIRKADRRAQGITEYRERQGREALKHARRLASDRLVVVQLPHGRTAVVADRLDPALGGPGAENLLVLTPEGPEFFGDGQIIERLKKSYPGGYYGGSLPAYGFWGLPKKADGVVDRVIRWVEDLDSKPEEG